MQNTFIENVGKDEPWAYKGIILKRNQRKVAVNMWAESDVLRDGVPFFLTYVHKHADDFSTA